MYFWVNSFNSAMLRAAAKNHQDVTVIVDNTDYQTVIDEINTLQGNTTLETRTITQAGSLKLRTHSSAASASAILLYDISLP
jgi:AICAR transformylase/IMP cyclohydrolase PurH